MDSSHESQRDPIRECAFHLDQFLVEVADVVNTTLDLDALLLRTAELVRRSFEYEIFAILLRTKRRKSCGSVFRSAHA